MESDEDFMDVPFAKKSSGSISSISSSRTTPTQFVEKISESSDVLKDDPVKDPGKEHHLSYKSSSSRCSSAISQPQLHEQLPSHNSSFSSAARRSLALRIPDGQTDESFHSIEDQFQEIVFQENLTDPTGYISDCDSESEESEDDEKDREDLSDNGAEYTPSYSCSDGDYSADDEFTAIKKATSTPSTLSNFKKHCSRKKEMESTENRKIRPATAVTNTSKRSKPPARPKTASSCQPSATKQRMSSQTLSPDKKKQSKIVTETSRHKTKHAAAENRSRKQHTRSSGNVKRISDSKPDPHKKENKANSQAKMKTMQSDYGKYRYDNRTSKRESRPHQKKKRFKRRVGERFVTLIEDVVTQMSLLKDDEHEDKGHVHIEKKTSQTKAKTKKSTTDQSTQKSSRKSKKRSQGSSASNSRSSSKQELEEQFVKWKNDYMRGLSMYMENQLKNFDKNIDSSWFRSREEPCKLEKKSSEGSSKNGTDHHKKARPICEKQPTPLSQLEQFWSEPDNKTKVSPRIRIPVEKVSPLGSEIEKKYLRKRISTKMKTLGLPRHVVKVYAAKDIKLVSYSGQLIIVGDGTTSISILGSLKSNNKFVAIKMLKLPHAVGKTAEIIDQAVLSRYLNHSAVTPTFHGLVVLDSVESATAGVHNVAMAYSFIGRTPSCTVNTLSSLCEKATSEPCPTEKFKSQLRTLITLKKVIEALAKVHTKKLVMPGLDIRKILLSEEDGFDRPYLSSRLHLLQNPTLAWPTVAYLGLKNSQTSYSKIKEMEVPPEALRKGQYTYKSDVFQLGKIFYHIGQSFDIPNLQNLAKRCVRPDPQHRPELSKIQEEIEKMTSQFQKKNS